MHTRTDTQPTANPLLPTPSPEHNSVPEQIEQSVAHAKGNRPKPDEGLGVGEGGQGEEQRGWPRSGAQTGLTMQLAREEPRRTTLGRQHPQTWVPPLPQHQGPIFTTHSPPIPPLT